MPVGLILGVIALALTFQAWVTRRVWRTDFYDRGQKSAQTVLVWALPLVGAAVALSALRHLEDPDGRPFGDRDGVTKLDVGSD